MERHPSCMTSITAPVSGKTGSRVMNRDTSPWMYRTVLVAANGTICIPMATIRSIKAVK